jgi:hypothetical protein
VYNNLLRKGLTMKNTIENKNRLLKALGELVTELKESKVSCDDFIFNTVSTLGRENPDAIYITWSTEDVQKLDKSLSKKEAQEILKHAGHKHDASVGINWDVLRAHIAYR